MTKHLGDPLGTLARILLTFLVTGSAFAQEIVRDIPASCVEFLHVREDSTKLVVWPTYPIVHTNPFLKLLEYVKAPPADADRIFFRAVMELSEDVEGARNHALEFLKYYDGPLDYMRVYLPDINDQHDREQTWAAAFLGGELRTFALLFAQDVEAWRQTVGEYEEYFAQHGLISLLGAKGHLLRKMPRHVQDEVLAKIGSRYVERKKDPREPSLADPAYLMREAHAILNPEGLLAEFRAAGRSDREFYSHYLQQVHLRVFRDHPEFGGYAGELPIRISQHAQRDFVANPNVTNRKAGFFFMGSVPNGFAHPKSDLDIFEIDSDGNDQFQITSSLFARHVNQELRGTPWQWKGKNVRNRAGEGLAIYNHRFAFHGTNHGVDLKFYRHSFLYDRFGNKLSLEESEVLRLDP